MKNKMKLFDKSYIETFAKPLNTQYVEGTYNYIVNILSEAINTICSKMPIITDYSTEVVNECNNFAETQNSSLDIFMFLKSPQLELSIMNLDRNYIKKTWNKVKSAWISANVKPKKRKNKQKHVISDKIELQKYTVSNLKIELINLLSKRFTNKTKLYNNNYGISILSKYDLGINVNIYFVFSNSENYKMFNTNTYKLIDIDFGERYQNIISKNASTNNQFSKMQRIINGLYSNITNSNLNQILLESLLYNCDDELYTGNTYEMFIKIFNYINISAIQKFKSITNENLYVFEDKLVTTSYVEFNRFMKNVSKLL